MRALQIRVEELERHIKISQSHYVDTFHALYETRAVLRQVYEANLEGIYAMQRLMQDDPAFMEMGGKND